MLKKILILSLFVFGGIIVYSQNAVSSIDTIQSINPLSTDLDSTYRTFKNTNIKIRTPKYFVEFESDELSGFMNTGTAASIVAFEYDSVPYVGYYDQFAEQALNRSNTATLLGSKDVKTKTGQPAKFFIYSFVVNDTEIRRIYFFTGNNEKMIFLEANYPAMFDAIIREVILKSFLTVKF